jgi:hypothetical protein
VALALAALGSKRCYVVAGKVQEALIPCRFFVRVHVLSLSVLNYLDLTCLLVGKLQNPGWHVGQLRDLRGTEASGSGYNLEAVTLGPHGDGLDEAVNGKAMGKLN